MPLVQNLQNRKGGGGGWYKRYRRGFGWVVLVTMQSTRTRSLKSLSCSVLLVSSHGSARHRSQTIELLSGPICVDESRVSLVYYNYIYLDLLAVQNAVSKGPSVMYIIGAAVVLPFPAIWKPQMMGP